MFGFRTIPEGERVAVWERDGRVTFVNGPRRLFLRAGQSVQALERHAAAADQYLVVRYKDGRCHHLHGPAAVWFNPVEHEAIRVEPAVALDGHEALVIYAQQGEAVGRRVVRGPALFMPAANEWLHTFQWHGSDPKNPIRKVPRAVQFTKLRVIPDQTYFDVADVRTADDALLVVQLMIFFELTDIEQMLDQTHDPVADFINAVSADVIDFTANLSFERFKESTHALNELATYPQLTGRAQRIGYRINKVVYRGYHATAKLQSMHDNAIVARTKLRLEAETDEQAQELADLRRARAAERAAQRRQMEEADVLHQNRLASLAHEEKLRQHQADRERRLQARRQANQVGLEHLRDRNRERLAFLQSMQGMEVDLTRYLVARFQNPDRVIRIDDRSSGGNGRGAQLHLHEG
jgi:hypothetical protein